MNNPAMPFIVVAAVSLVFGFFLGFIISAVLGASSCGRCKEEQASGLTRNESDSLGEVYHP